MNRFLLLCFFTLCYCSVFGQSITIKGIEKDVPDLSASVGLDTYAPDGINWPIIKFRTMEKGFQIDAGTVHPKVEYKIGEVWIYVQPRTRFLTIAHEKFGKSNTLNIIPPCESSTVYQLDVEMIAADGKNVNVINTKYCVVRVEPKDAAVYIDGELRMPIDGEVQNKLEYGKHELRVESNMYHPYQQQIVVDDNLQPIDVKLTPNFGWLNITTTPENGADILIDGVRQTTKTPFKTDRMKSGEYTIVVSKDMYATTTQRAVVKDNETTNVNINLPQNFANITIAAVEGADIYIDGKRMGSSKWEGRLNEGVYAIEARKDKHITQAETIKVVKGVAQTVKLELVPIVGTLEIMCVPSGSKITIGGKDYGTTPQTISGLLVGNYELVLSKEGFGTERRQITIEDGKTLEINTKLSTGKEITITSSPSGVSLYVDGSYVGVTPKTMPMSFGNHKIKLDNNGKKQVEESITVSETGKSSFDFNVNYSKTITFKSYPKSEVRIDGNYKGVTSVNVPLDYKGYSLTMNYKSKTHTDYFYVNDNTNSVYEYNFKTRPNYLLTYGVSVPFADKFMLSSYADIYFGIVVNKVGWYIRAKSNFDFTKKELTYSNGILNIPIDTELSYLESNGESRISRFGAATGIVVKLAKPLYLSLGGGYGYANYLIGLTQTQNGTTSDVWAKSLDNSFRGFEMDCNFLFKFGGFGLNAGVTTVSFKYCEATLGVGVWF